MPFVGLSHKLHSWSKFHRLGKCFCFFFPHLPFPLLGASIHSLCKDLMSSSLATFKFSASSFAFFFSSARSSYKPQNRMLKVVSSTLHQVFSLTWNTFLICAAVELNPYNMVRILSSRDFWNCWKTVACTDLDKSYKSPTTVTQNQLWQCPTSRYFELAHFDLILRFLSTFFCNQLAFFLQGLPCSPFITFLNNVLFMLPPGSTVPCSLSSHFLLTILSDFTSFLAAMVVN